MSSVQLMSTMDSLLNGAAKAMSATLEAADALASASTPAERSVVLGGLAGKAASTVANIADDHPEFVQSAMALAAPRAMALAAVVAGSGLFTPQGTTATSAAPPAMALTNVPANVAGVAVGGGIALPTALQNPAIRIHLVAVLNSPPDLESALATPQVRSLVTPLLGQPTMLDGILADSELGPLCRCELPRC